MGTNVIILIVVCVALFAWMIYLYIRHGKEARGEDKSFEAVVVADLGKVLILRNESGELYLFNKEKAEPGDVKVDDLLFVKPIQTKKYVAAEVHELSLNVYGISKQKDAKHAQVIRRLNKEFALCKLGKMFIFVRCTAGEQTDAQTLVSMVVGLNGDGNDRQALTLKDVLSLPVEFVAGLPNLEECVIA